MSLDLSLPWQVIQGDCLDVMRALPDGCVDAVVTDPPYGLGSWSSTGGNSISAAEAAKANEWDVAPSAETIRRIASLAPAVVVWGGNYFFEALGSCRSPLVWDKRIRGMHFADGEMAWTNFRHGTLRIFELAAGASDARGNREHPTQKPIALMKWCIGLCKIPADSLIIDPYCGSGTTGVAAVQLGYRFLGIERESQYVEISRRRIADAFAQGSLGLDVAAPPREKSVPAGPVDLQLFP